jgi:4-amino-4-deoxy-L-arabinose transferase
MYQWNHLFSYLPVISKLLGFVSLLFIVFFVVIAYKYPQKKWSYLFLFSAISFIGLAFIFIEPWLSTWDEQFHALVAKNMANHPLTPQLITYRKAELAVTDWTNTTIWLHKQPLFLWQMALSVKLFGAHYWSIRIPSVLLHAATTLAVFAIAKRFLSTSFSLLTATLYGYCFFILDFVSGTIGMDHNDIAFIFYITASSWAYLKYLETKKWQFALLIGILSGGAILTKWLVGLLVFAGWVVTTLIYFPKDRANWKSLFLAFGSCLLLFIPWQLFCSVYYPTQFWHEMAYNATHFSQAVENHTGDFWYYIDTIKKTIGSGFLLISAVASGLIVFIIRSFKRSQQGQLHLYVVIISLVTFLFFTVAATKLDGYLLIIAPFLFIFLLVPFQLMVDWVSKKYTVSFPIWTKSLLILLVCFSYVNPKKITEHHNFETPNYKLARINAIKQCLNIEKQYPHASAYLVKGFYEPIVPALRFETSKNFLVYYPKLENETSVIIDLSSFDPRAK